MTPQPVQGAPESQQIRGNESVGLGMKSNDHPGQGAEGNQPAQRKMRQGFDAPHIQEGQQGQPGPEALGRRKSEHHGNGNQHQTGLQDPQTPSRCHPARDQHLTERSETRREGNERRGIRSGQLQAQGLEAGRAQIEPEKLTSGGTAGKLPEGDRQHQKADCVGQQQVHSVKAGTSSPSQRAGIR